MLIAAPQRPAGLLAAVLCLILGTSLAPSLGGQAVQTSPGPVAARAQDVPTGALGLLDATLWTQQAAERRALCLQTFRLATERLEQALLDPSWSAAEEQGPGAEALPPAVIVDVDETILDNVPYQARLVRSGAAFEAESWNAWCREQAATPVPGALAFCRRARELGVAVFYVTNRDAAAREDTRAVLSAWGFPLTAGIECVLTRDGPSDKGPRRAALAERFRILLLVGDAGSDFSSALGNGTGAVRRAATDERAARWGREWIMLPNPMYGPWESAVPQPPGMSRTAARVAALSPDGLRPDAAAIAAELAVVRGADGRAPTRSAADDAHHPLLDAGPMPTWREPTSCGLWLRTKSPVDAQVRYWPAGEPAAARLSSVQGTTRAGDLVTTFALHDLRPGTTYAYEVYLDGERASRPWPLSFSTQPLWLFRGTSREAPHAPPDLRIALGSCAYVNDPPYDRLGRPYGGDYHVFDNIADLRPDLMLWLGDNTYLRPGDWEDAAAIRRRYAHTRALPELQRLLGSTHHLAIWDDHDYGPNDSDHTYRLARQARAAFVDYWPDSAYPAGDEGIFRRVQQGDVEFFLLDDRTWRSPNDAPASPEKRMLGAAQLRWLIDGLQSSQATFKVVANGGQMLNPVVNYEGFAEFPDERTELLDALRERAIDCVLFVSGDRHHSELLRLERDGLPPLYEFTCSPLTAGSVDRDLDGEHPARVPGTLVTQRNFGLLEVSGPAGARVVTLSVRDVDGAELWRHVIPQDELRRP